MKSNYDRVTLITIFFHCLVFSTIPCLGQNKNQSLFSFIMRSHLLLLNSKPTSFFIDSCAFKITKDTINGKQQYLTNLVSEKAYFQNMVSICRIDFLNNTSTKAIRDVTDEYGFLITYNSVKDYNDVLNSRLHKLAMLLKAEEDFSIGLISYQQVQQRYLDNSLYDEINMGPDNFVISCFMHLLMRHPTKAEITEAKKMITGYSGYLLNKNGTGRESFFNILFNSDAYKESQVRYWFSYYFNRDPTQEEILHYLQFQKIDFDVRTLQTTLLFDLL